jgi:hypothetical protein
MPVVTCSEGLSARYRPVALSSSALLGSPEGVLDLVADRLQEPLSYRDGEPVRGITSRQRQPSEATGPAGWSRPGASRS